VQVTVQVGDRTSSGAAALGERAENSEDQGSNQFGQLAAGV